MDALQLECLYCGNIWEHEARSLEGIRCPKCSETSLLRQKKRLEAGSNPFGYPVEDQEEREETPAPSPPCPSESPPEQKDTSADDEEGPANRDAEPIDDGDPFSGWPGYF